MAQIKSNFFTFCLFYLFTLVLFLSISSVISNAQSLSNRQRAEEIINQSRKAVRGKNESVKIKGLSVTFSSTERQVFTKNNGQPKPSESVIDREMDLSFPDKVKFSLSLTSEENDSPSVSKFILNGDQFNSESYAAFGGKKVNINLEQTEEQKKEAILRTKKQNFLWVFPLILESSDYVPVEFVYIGKAQVGSSGERADVLETVLHDQSKLRLFFDEQSHLLKMLINAGTTSNGAVYEEKRFFSDYKEKNGFLIPNKITTEETSVVKTGKFETSEEINLKSIEFNPTFKPDFFKMK